jgi:hypothetical protein
MMFDWGEAQETDCLKITILFTFGNTLILRHYDLDKPALLKTDESDFAIAGILSQKVKEGKIHPVRSVSRKFVRQS